MTTQQNSNRGPTSDFSHHDAAAGPSAKARIGSNFPHQGLHACCPPTQYDTSLSTRNENNLLCNKDGKSCLQKLSDSQRNQNHGKEQTEKSISASRGASPRSARRSKGAPLATIIENDSHSSFQSTASALNQSHQHRDKSYLNPRFYKSSKSLNDSALFQKWFGLPIGTVRDEIARPQGDVIRADSQTAITESQPSEP